VSAPLPDTVPLSTVLAGTAAELAAIADRAVALDEAFGDMIAAAGDHPDLRRGAASLQEIDRLRQTADCLRILAGNLAQLPLADIHVPAGATGKGIYLTGGGDTG